MAYTVALIIVASLALWLVQSILTKWVQVEPKEVSGWYLLVDSILASLRSLGVERGL